MYARKNKHSNCTTNELLPFVLMTELYRGLTAFFKIHLVYFAYSDKWLGFWGLLNKEYIIVVLYA